MQLVVEAGGYTQYAISVMMNDRELLLKGPFVSGIERRQGNSLDQIHGYHGGDADATVPPLTRACEQREEQKQQERRLDQTADENGDVKEHPPIFVKARQSSQQSEQVEQRGDVAVRQGHDPREPGLGEKDQEREARVEPPLAKVVPGEDNRQSNCAGQVQENIKIPADAVREEVLEESAGIEKDGWIDEAQSAMDRAVRISPGPPVIERVSIDPLRGQTKTKDRKSMIDRPLDVQIAAENSYKEQ